MFFWFFHEQNIQLNKTGRLPDTGLPVIENGSTVMDMAWDTFNNHRLAVGKLQKFLFKSLFLKLFVFSEVAYFI